MSRKARILLVDNHPAFRAGLCQLLSEEKGLAVAGEANNGRQAIELATKFSPHLVLMDITMPKKDGLEAKMVNHQSKP